MTSFSPLPISRLLLKAVSQRPSNLSFSCSTPSTHRRASAKPCAFGGGRAFALPLPLVDESNSSPASPSPDSRPSMLIPLSSVPRLCTVTLRERRRHGTPSTISEYRWYKRERSSSLSWSIIASRPELTMSMRICKCGVRRVFLRIDWRGVRVCKDKYWWTRDSSSKRRV